MIELTPHPVFRLPDPDMARYLSLDELNDWIAKFDKRIREERDDPFRNGFEPEVWKLVDDLLVDGNKVVLDLTRIAKLMPDGQAPLIPDVPKVIEGACEIWIPGANRSSKSEYAAKKMVKVLDAQANARTWSFADTGPISIARQQPLFWKYMPKRVKDLAADTGKARFGVTLNVSYKQKTGFAEQSFVLPNGSQHWFKNYEQDLQNVEGDQLDAIWLDELRNIELLRTLRGRTIDRGGLIIVTFTSIDENYTSVVNEYERGARTVLEVDAELLPIKRPKDLSGVGSRELRRPELGQHSDDTPAQNDLENPSLMAHELLPIKRPKTISPDNVTASTDGRIPDVGGNGVAKAECDKSPYPSRIGVGASTSDDLEIIGYEKVPRVKVAGPGNDGNLRANIVFFHITDNPYFGYEGAMGRRKSGRAPIFGKERFYRAYRNATRSKILSRVYGILQAGSSQQFPKFSDAVHVVEPERIPRHGTNYQIVDPCDGRNWAMLWLRIDPAGRWYWYREWPSTGHAGAYIPGHGDIGPWTVPGKPADGVRGPAQTSLGFGLDAYKNEIKRLEGWPKEAGDTPATTEEDLGPARVTGIRARRIPHGLRPAWAQSNEPRPKEEIAERWMDSRYGSLPTRTVEGQTTLIEQCADMGLEFRAASGKEIVEGVTLVNDMLDYDKDVSLGQWSPVLGRLNAPKMYVSSACPNLIYAMREWTGKDGNKGACKDWVDLLRYAALAELDYIGEGAYTWEKG